MQGSANLPLSHRAPSAGGRHRNCRPESEDDQTVTNEEGETISVDGRARRSIAKFCRCRNRRLLGRRSVFSDTALPLPQQLAVWRRDAFWKREPKSQNNPSRRTGPEGSIRVMMQVPKLRHEQRPKSQNLCKHFREQCPPVLGLVPWLFLALLSSLYTG